MHHADVDLFLNQPVLEFIHLCRDAISIPLDDLERRLALFGDFLRNRAPCNWVCVGLVSCEKAAAASAGPRARGVFGYCRGFSGEFCAFRMKRLPALAADDWLVVMPDCLFASVARLLECLWWQLDGRCCRSWLRCWRG